mgnify:CR=1 FL=1
MKALFFLLLILTAACSKPDKREFSDDYVLIEFASKLEENYHQLHPTADPNQAPSNSDKAESHP